jgi:5-methylcytosine-specific restriction endonuclease McrA
LIRDIEVGDQVLAWDPATNQPKLETVTHTFSRITDDIYRLTLADAAGRQSTTTVTGNHPYLLAANDNAALLALVAANDNGPASGQAAPAADATILRIEPGGSWKIVRHLAPGDQIRTALNGAVVFGPGGGHLVSAPGLDTLTVVSVTLDRSPRRVHNLEVSNLHSFAVGELGEWVHNTRNGRGDYIPVIASDLARRLAGGVCMYCHQRFTNGHRDHRIPHACGGSNDWWNIDLICAPCNLRKGKMTLEQFEKKIGKLIRQ